MADGNGGKRRLFYLARPAVGGMLKHLQQLLRRFSLDYSLYLAMPRGNGGADTAGLRADAFFPLPLSGGLSPAADMVSFLRLRMLLCRTRPALLHIHGFKAALPGLAAARSAGVPALITVHNCPAHRASRYMPAAWNMLGAHEAQYIAVSNVLARELTVLGIPRRRISVIHNGLDPAPFERAAAGRSERPRAAGEIIVGTAARFAPQKGLTYFVQAAAALAPLFPRMRFLVIGDGPGRSALERQSLELGFTGALTFCGYCSDLPKRLAGIDIFVLPSLAEGLPLALLEAAAAGCAVVATSVGGIPEVITTGVHGLLVPPADTVALARAIAGLARDPALARRLSRACRERVVAGFTLERMLSRTAALYARLLDKPAVGRRSIPALERAGNR